MAQPSDMSTATTAQPVGGPDEVRTALSGRYVCPFCGSVNDAEQGTCPRCTMENTAASRKATKLRIGPWYVLQSRNPAAPGMRWDTLLSFVKKGRVKPTSIVRGPSTHQLWRFAAQVKGLSREFGVCYSCGGGIGVADSLCSQCNRMQDPPPNPDALLETAPETPQRPAAASPSPGPAPKPPARNGNPEPTLESGDAEFVIPTPGASDSLAGFAMNDSLAGVVMDQPWARLDKSRANGNRPAGPRSQPPVAAQNRPAPSVAPNGKRREAPAPQTTTPEGFLSARDLAAAFRLELAPGADDEAGGAPPAATTPPVRPAAARPPGAPQYPDASTLFERPARRRQKLKILLVLIVLLAGVLGLAAAVSESFRKATVDWFEKTRNATTETPAPAPKVATPQPADSTTQSPTRALPRPTATPTPKPPASTETDTAATRPARGPDPARPAAIAPAPAARPPTPEPPASDPEILRAAAEKLYSEALACESRGDWAGAVAKYQAIKAYPKELWRQDLQLRLNVAEGQVKQGP